MPEFLRLLPPGEARRQWFSRLPPSMIQAEQIDTAKALNRVTVEDILAPHALPEFPRSTVDGYAVRAVDTFGATDSLPSYLKLVGEVPMGSALQRSVASGESVLIHTGGMLPVGANAVAMLEHTQVATSDDGGEGVQGSSPQAARVRTVGSGAIAKGEIEVLRPVAEGENVIQVGEDVAAGQLVIPRGIRLRPAEVGGLMALGITALQVARKPRIGLISSGDEVVPPNERPRRGQVRDVNAYALASAVSGFGGEPVIYGIAPDEPDALGHLAAMALAACDGLAITAGSSASARDRTADVIRSLGDPGVLVHGVNTRPGKPTILGVCNGKAVIGLPGNPVSALVNSYLFLAPLIEMLLGLPLDRERPLITARLSLNLASEAGREDWWPVKLQRVSASQSGGKDEGAAKIWIAEPVFGRSNMIFTLVRADGLLRIPPEVTGLSAGDTAEVMLF